MWCFGIRNIKTGKISAIIGYYWENAWVGSKLNPDEWECIYKEYLD